MKGRIREIDAHSPRQRDATSEPGVPPVGSTGQRGNGRIGEKGWLLGWAAALAVVVAVAFVGRLTDGSAKAAPAEPTIAVASGPASPAHDTTAARGQTPGAAPTDRAGLITGRPRPSLPLLVIDLPDGASRYGQAAILATMRVTGTVRGVRPPEVVIHVLASGGEELGQATGPVGSDGRFGVGVDYAPPAGDQHVRLVVRAGRDGSLLRSTSLTLPAAGDLAIWSPSRLDGWRRGDRIPVEALVRSGTSTRVVIHLVDDEGTIRAAATTRAAGVDDGWGHVEGSIRIPADVPLGRLWLELVAKDADGGSAAARLLLDVSR